MRSAVNRRMLGSNPSAAAINKKGSEMISITYFTDGQVIGFLVAIGGSLIVLGIGWVAHKQHKDK